MASEALTMSTLIHPRRFIALSVFVSVLILSTACTPDVTDIREQGVAQFRARQYLESTATLRHVLELAPNDAQANYYMALNYRANADQKFKQGDVVAARRELDTAIVYFSQAIKTWPNYMAAVAAKNEAFELRGKYDEAIATAQRVADNNRGIAEHYVFLGNEYRDRGDYDNALRAYKLALSTDPNSAQAYDAMGQLYARIGDEALASDAFRRAGEIGTGRGVTYETAASPTTPPQDRPRPTRTTE